MAGPFRHAAMRLGAGAGAGAAAAGPSSAHCYSRPAARPGNAGPRTEDGWILPQILDNNQIFFSEEEVNSTVNLFLGLPEGAKPAAVVTEVEGSSDDDSSVGSANLHIEEADNRLAHHQELQHGFSRTLQGLLNNREVQRACVQALATDPAFGDMVARLPQGSLSDRQVEFANLLPPAAQVAEVGDGDDGDRDAEDPFKDFLDGLADRARGVGEKIKSTWDSVGNTVGQAIIRFGYAIHAMLGRPFRQEMQYPEQAEWRDLPANEQTWFQNPDAVGKVVIKVACVIVALMVFKRVVRF